MTEKNCGTCKHWQPLQPDDASAPEGICQNPDWKGPLWLGAGTKAATFAYHPATLRRDHCAQQEPATLKWLT